jgi:HEAT repeat protein
MALKNGNIFGDRACVIIIFIMLLSALAGLAAGQAEEKSITGKMLHNLSNKDAKIRGEAAWALGKSGDERAIEPLIKSLEDSNRNVREWAALALVKIGKPSIGPLIAALQSGNDSVKWQAAALLGMINDSNSAEALSAALKSNNSTVRYWAAAALGQIRESVAQDALIASLADENQTVRNEAGWALKPLGGEDLLISLLKDEEPKRRMGAAHSLGDSAYVQAALPLIEALNDSDSGVRSEAADAMGRRGERQSIDPLIGSLADPEEQVKKQAIAALAAIGKPAVEPLTLALQNSDNATRAGAAAALGMIGEENSAAELISSFKSGDHAVRLASVGSLVRINRSFAVLPLIDILEDQSLPEDLRADAAWGLGDIGDARAKDSLVYAMSYDKDNGVRMSAAKAMKKVMKAIFDE